jgi:virginiamycin B lyase
MTTVSFRTQCIFATLVLAGCGGNAAVTPEQAFQNAPGNTVAVHKTSLAQRASFTEFSLPPGQRGASSVALDRNGTPWVLTQFAIDRVRTDGHVTTFQMPSRVRGLYGGIAFGRDGALWFLGDVSNPTERPQGNPWLTNVFRLTTNGKLSSYPFGHNVFSVEGNLPQDITSGLDGELWFTVSTFSPSEPCLFYGGISTRGDLRPLKALCAAKGITKGPDGTMWVASGGPVPGGEGVVRYSAQTNAATVLKLPLASNPESIATGPDNNVWITLAGLNAIMRLTTTGKKTTYLLPTPNRFNELTNDAQEARIVSGTNAMWFIEARANNIARISMSGRITEYAIPTPGSGATGLAISSACGSYGVHLWFVESARNKIAMMATRC